MKPYLKAVETIVTVDHVTDMETGEIVDSITGKRARSILVNNEKEFLQLYFSLNGLLDKLSSAESRLLLYLSFKCDGENKIALPKYIKEELATESGLHIQTINNSLTKLTKKGFLIRIATGLYRINPRYVWKRSLNERDKMLKYVLEVECPNC